MFWCPRHRPRASVGTDAAPWLACARAFAVRGAPAAALGSRHWDARRRRGATTSTAARPRHPFPRCRPRRALLPRRSRPIRATVDGPSGSRARARSPRLRVTLRTTGARASSSAAPDHRRPLPRLSLPPRSTAGAGAAGRGPATASVARGERAAVLASLQPVVQWRCQRGATGTIAAWRRCPSRHRLRLRRRRASPSRAAASGWRIGLARGRRRPGLSVTRQTMGRPATPSAATRRRHRCRRHHRHRRRRLAHPPAAGAHAVQERI
eukprot:scaffold2253_cov115-Isochrysis_galbana.AAC.1